MVLAPSVVLKTSWTLPLLDGIDDVRTAFEHLVDALGGDSPARRDNRCVPEVARMLEAEFAQLIAMASRMPAACRNVAHGHKDGCPSVGTLGAGAELGLGEGVTKARVEPMTSPVERISGPSTVSTPGNGQRGRPLP
jgi:hypothetical protein